MHNVSLGRATTDPYSFVNAIRCDNREDVSLSFDGGVFTADEPTWICFDHIDFGDYGSDEITVPIFSFSDNVPLAIRENGPDGELLFEGLYEAKSIYNTYQSNTFRLSKRLRGVTGIAIRVPFRLSLHGFVFTKLSKEFSPIGACDLASASGDGLKPHSFLVGIHTDFQLKIK